MYLPMPPSWPEVPNLVSVSLLHLRYLLESQSNLRSLSAFSPPTLECEHPHPALKGEIEND